MSIQSNYFLDLAALKRHFQSKNGDRLVVAHRSCEGYEGMVLCIMIMVDFERNKYELDLEWICFGLDFYGDTLQESYTYTFQSIESLLTYLSTKYAIQITDIPIEYHVNYKQFPNPMTHKAQKPIFEAIWKRFQEDFKNDVFLDNSLTLVSD